MQNYVFVLNPHKQPLSPIHPAKARLLLKQGKAAVFRHPLYLQTVHRGDGYEYQFSTK